MARDYAHTLRRLGAEPWSGLSRQERMERVVDVLWDAFHAAGLSWIGFYTGEPGADHMILRARRDKPACSPLGLEGMCGRCWQARRPILLHDAQTLAGGYIACDPRDRSEAVIPLFEPDGSCWGVLDADSFDVGSFDEADIAGMTRAVEIAGLSVSPARPAATLSL